jgi:surfeit locus 1 family protein
MIAVAVLIGLGGWQLERLQWKNHLLAELEAEYSKDPGRVRLTRDDIRAVASGKAMLRRGSITGRYLHNHEMRLRASYYKGESGVDILTPFQVKGHKTLLLVNRGWAPPDKADPADRPKSRVRGTMSITGTLMRAEGHVIGTPDNKPEKGQWYYAAPEQMAEAQGLSHVAPVIFRVEAEPSPGTYPKARTERPRPHNRHLYYAIFWFTMAAVLLVVFYLRFVRQARS